ncbi:FAD-dependent oxidoreductase [Thermodesulfobacteriota bacterium]
MHKVKHLFRPETIGSIEIPNRIVMLAMHLAFATEDGFTTDRLKNFYVERAKGGAGLLIMGFANIDRLGKGQGLSIDIYDDKYIPGLKEMAEACKVYGCHVFLQLSHQGGTALPKFIGQQPVSCSAVTTRKAEIPPRELTIPEIHEIVDRYGEAARRTKEASFDGIELVASTNTLVNQFLSPITNKRGDEYGGELKNRMRFLFEVNEAIRGKVGDDYPLSCRIVGDELMEGGNGIAEAVKIAQELEKTGVDAINVNLSWHEVPVPQIAMSVPRGAFAYTARAVKEAVDIPVIATGRINDPILANRLIQENITDFVGMGRGFIADPELPRKAKEQRFDEIRPCIACNQGCFDYAFIDRPITCTVNTAVGREEECKISKTNNPKKVLVIGGGPGGMEAARVASLRGHNVSLHEKSQELGGYLNLAAMTPGREEFGSLVKYLNTQLKKLGVNISQGAEAKLESIDDEKPDVVIVATGSRPIIPDIPGIDGENVFTADDVLTGIAETGRKVVVVGGGGVGCETAIYLGKKGTSSPEVCFFLAGVGAVDHETMLSLNRKGTKDITIVEMLPKIGRSIGVSTRWTIFRTLKELGVSLLTNARVERVNDHGVIVEIDGDEKLLEADTIVIAAGHKSHNSLLDKLKMKLPEIYGIGDCTEPRTALEAIREAYDIANKI